MLKRMELMKTCQVPHCLHTAEWVSDDGIALCSGHFKHQQSSIRAINSGGTRPFSGSHWSMGARSRNRDRYLRKREMS